MPLKRRLLVLAACFLLAAPVLADETTAPPAPTTEATPVTVFSFGRENADCAEWTNACQVCTRPAAGEMQCSTPGIACTPGPPVCRVKKEP